jgi:phage shock protein A
MSIIKKLFTLFRGTAYEAGQTVVDANAIKILDQEMRDAGTQLARSRDELTKLMAQSKLSQGKLDARAGKMAELGRYIEGALGKGDQALALEVAGKLAPLEVEQKTEATAKEALDRSIATLKDTIKKTEVRLNGMRTQIDQVKATEAVQRAQAAIAQRHAGTNSQMTSALDSLARIQSRQAEQAARIEAAEELESETGDGDLNKRLAAAGLLTESGDAHAVLARFTQPKQLAHEPITVEVVPVSVPVLAAPDAVTKQ